ncbi:keratin, type I cytoskeletal 9-like [Lucilia sericata]|uniref:keratin, type I cytoskeletal 9-like n=1 Tax=Lucilia sericata TaxID=13632 RepID=UPI0018A80146|nr:keratin, type I cytoskeletal 9-like [Lucilia sericata]
MHKVLVFVYCAIIAFILVSTAEAKGGRGGGGRSGGRSSGRSSSGRGGFFGSSKSSSSSSFGSGKSSHFGGSHGGSHTSGGWVNGFFHSTPYRYSYRPIYISRTSTHTGSYHVPNKEEEEATDHNKDTGNYAVGYSISKALSNDFFSIFNVVHDISKYPEKIRNKELTTTTTQSPVDTYDLNYIINTPYTTTRSIYDTDPKSYFLDDDTLFDMMTSKKTSDENIHQDYDAKQSSVENLDNVLEESATESTTTVVDYIKSNSDFKPISWRDNTMSNTGIISDYNDESIQKMLKGIQSSVVNFDNISEGGTFKRTEKKDPNESVDEMLKQLQKNMESFKLY